jgi:hypothetical protein
MTYPEADIPLAAPSLLALSAGTIADHAQMLGNSNNKNGPHLPLATSTAVFDALRKQWIDKVSLSIYRSHIFVIETCVTNRSRIFYRW